MKNKLVVMWLVGCASVRPPNAEETAHGLALNACVEVSERESDYIECRKKVNARFGVDGGVYKGKNE